MFKDWYKKKADEKEKASDKAWDEGDYKKSMQHKGEANNYKEMAK